MIVDYKTKYAGLTSQDVENRINKGQINISQNDISKSKKQIVLEHTLTYFNFLNLFLAGVIISTGRLTNLTFIFVIIVNSIIGIFQEFQVKKIIDKLIVVTVKKVKVIRNSVLNEIPVENLVIDDVIFLESGEQIGTDCIVLESHGMEVDESLLTGESESIKKKENDELFSGSFVLAGTAYAKVIRVGNDNYSTQLVQKAKHKNKASSEMKTIIEKIIKILSFVIIPVGLVLFVSQLNANPGDHAIALVKTVAGVVGMIPEGLVLLTSLSFILGVGKLARKKALIQEMEAIEALARVNVLCLDKTGTITTGELDVVDIIPLYSQTKEELTEILGAVAHHFDDVNETQLALQKYANKPEGYVVKSFIPFSSKRKMRAIEFEQKGCYALGAPEFLTHDEVVLNKVEVYAVQGMRVLLLGSLSSMDAQSISIEGFKPIGLIVIKDCIRDEAKETLSYFDKNNVDICILSGDNPMTVSRVAQLAGLKKADQYIDASLLPTNEEELRKIVQHYYVYGRVKPEQKQAIIKAMQANGLVVGMVGDGVNDVLAIKDADCGIAMASGSDAAKQAAHIVLLDSCFASMMQIVEEGRTIIADIERVSSLYLTKTIYSTALCLIFAGLQMSYPFTPLQMSLISGLAIGIPSFFLTLEKSHATLSQGFLKHIISTAIPCALTMIIYMVFIAFLGKIMHFDTMMYSTYYYLVAGFISFLVVVIVCMPLTRLRMVLVVSIITLFYSILLIMHDFFEIYSFLDPRAIWIAPLCISAFFMVQIIKEVIRYIYKHYENRSIKSS